MMDFKRQIAMFDPSKHEQVHCIIVGCGNIGSHTALALARMGVKKFSLIDFDTVEGHNLSSQAFLHGDIGRLKVDALADLITAISPEIEVEKNGVPFLKAKISMSKDTIVISAVDSMATRAVIAETITALSPNTFVIDGRLGGGQIELYAQKARAWGATLVDGDDADPCGARYISYTSYIIAGCIANTLKRYLQGEKYTSKLLIHSNNYEIIKTML